MSLREHLAAQQRLIDAALDRLVPAESEPPETIHRAMRYSLFAGGKRIRPILCLEAAGAVAGGATGGVEAARAVAGAVPDEEAVAGLAPLAEAAACSLELVHTYSLIHDDLPALDNDNFRRGRLTCHKQFNEAIAILAGDALLTLAFQVLARADSIPAERKLRLVGELAAAAGTVGGMVGGQVADLEGEGKPPTPELLTSIHGAKTGALITASVRMGAICADASERQLEALTRYGRHIGLAFQIVDDVLDIEQPSEALGKTAGKDTAQRKITFPAVYGLEESRRMAERERQAAHDALDCFGERAQCLRELADLIVSRKQ